LSCRLLLIWAMGFCLLLSHLLLLLQLPLLPSC
jgi:hypothetical protein